jgi:predicted nuclease of predicted toxin-antitoxin system
MNLKLDENLSRHLKPKLAVLGHDALTAADEGLLSQPDTAIASAASREGRVLLTLDLEFANLRKHPPGSHPGVVLSRPRSFGPMAVNAFVEEFVRTTDLTGFAGCVVVVEPARVRVRRPPLKTDGPEWIESQT